MSGGGVQKVLTTGLIDNGLQKGLLYSPTADAEKAQKKLAGSLAQPIQQPKVLPTIDSQAVQSARNNRLVQLQAKSGRASTILTNSNTFGG